MVGVFNIKLPAKQKITIQIALGKKLSFHAVKQKCGRNCWQRFDFAIFYKTGTKLEITRSDDKVYLLLQGI